MRREQSLPIAQLGVCLIFLAVPALSFYNSQDRSADSTGLLGREISCPTHLRDGQEFSSSLQTLVEHGAKLFRANVTEIEGAGRPLTKGTGRPLTDSSRPL